MNNDDIFVRKDIFDAEKQHTFDMLSGVHRRIDDMHSTFTYILTVISVCFGIFALGFPFVLYYLQH